MNLELAKKIDRGRSGRKGDKSNGMQTIEMRAAAHDIGGGFVPLVGQQLHVLFSRSADFVLAKLTGEIKLRIERTIVRTIRANHE